MSAQPGLVVVTGASGFIGRALVERLGAVGFEVVGLDRPGGQHPPPNADAIDLDIASDASVRSVMRAIRERHGPRIASVVHLAGYYSFSGEPSPLYDEINVRGTERLLAALQDFACEQFVFASTMLVHAPCEPGSYIDEDSPLHPTWVYPQSKLATEEAVRHARGRIPAVIARIAGVYDDLGHSPILAGQMQRIYERQLESHWFPGHISHGQSSVHLDDLLDFFERAVRRRHALPPELTVLVGESEPLNYDALQHILGRLIHGESWDTHEIPKPVAKAGAWLKRALPGEEPIKPWMIERAADHYALDTHRAREYLDWRPRHQLRESLPAIVGTLKADPERWYRVNKLEPPRTVSQ